MTMSKKETDFFIEETGCESDALFSLQVLDDSMEPEFPTGCVIIIDPANTIKNGSFVLANPNDEYIFRQLLIQEDRYYLKPMRESYPVMEISGLDVIRGVIVQRAGKRRKDHKHYV